MTEAIEIIANCRETNHHRHGQARSSLGRYQPDYESMTQSLYTEDNREVETTYAKGKHYLHICRPSHETLFRGNHARILCSDDTGTICNDLIA